MNELKDIFNILKSDKPRLSSATEPSRATLIAREADDDFADAVKELREYCQTLESVADIRKLTAAVRKLFK